MPRLNRFVIKIHTGDKPLVEEPRVVFNGFLVSLEKKEGGTGKEQTFQAEFAPRSFVHNFSLRGPGKGHWHIRRIDMRYECEWQNPYELSFDEVTLDGETELNLWMDAPLPVWDV